MEKLKEDFIIQQAIEASGGTDWCAIAFSGGKDSIAVFLRLWEKKVFKKFLLIHQYMVDGLSFVEDYLDYFADRFPEVTIANFQSPLMTKVQASGSFQDYYGYKAVMKAELSSYSYQFLVKDLTTEYTGKVRCDAVGIKYSDSHIRRMAANRWLRGSNPTIINWKGLAFYPILDYAPIDVWKKIKEHKVKLSQEYKMYGKSLDGFNPLFLVPIKRYYPEDFKKIERDFPQINIIIKRYERYGK